MRTGSEIDGNAQIDGEKAIPFLPTATIAIIGLGLIGGSAAMALRGGCAGLLGIDLDPIVVRKAIADKVVDYGSTDPATLLPHADLVLIAVPVLSSLELIQRLPELHPGYAMVMDMGSTKLEVIHAMEALPNRFDPIGGHPMCGKEDGTLINAEAGLFQQAQFALVPLARTSTHCREAALELVAALGSHPLWLQAEEHDRCAAITSHLPHLLATALALSTTDECAPLIGTGFRSTSRLAAGSAQMKTEIFATNKQAVLDALESFQYQLDTLSTTISQGNLQELHHMLVLGAERRKALLAENDGIDG
jgi:prephenate dehydrogenase